MNSFHETKVPLYIYRLMSKYGGYGYLGMVVVAETTSQAISFGPREDGKLLSYWHRDYLNIDVLGVANEGIAPGEKLSHHVWD